MNTSQAAPQTIDEYIAALPKDVQELLEQVRATIQKAAPDAQVCAALLASCVT